MFPSLFVFSLLRHKSPVPAVLCTASLCHDRAVVGPHCQITVLWLVQPNMEDVLETLQIIAKTFGYPVPDGPATHADMVPLSHPLSRVEVMLRHGGRCDVCSAVTRMPFVTPCAHLLCVDCAAKDSHACSKCGTAFKQQPVDDPARHAADLLLPSHTATGSSPHRCDLAIGADLCEINISY